MYISSIWMPSTLDMMLIVALAVPAGPISPVGAGPPVVVEGRNERLRWAAVAEHGQHDGDKFGGRLETVSRVSRISAKVGPRVV